MFAAIAFLAGCKSRTIAIDSTVPAVLATISREPNLDAGVNGKLQEYMSTAFQPAVWQVQFFEMHPEEQDPQASPLVALQAPHVLVQMIDSPWKGASRDASHWDFTELDAIVQPLQRMHQDPLIQIASAPSWINVPDPSFADFCANIVRYYNAEGGLLLDDGGAIKSDAGPINWWAIWSDPNTTPDNQFTGPIYASLYNDAVQRMRNADDRIHFAAPEFNDCTDYPACDPSTFVRSFLASAGGGGADGGKTPIGALSMHMFSTSSAVARDAGLATDRAVLQTVSRFATDVAHFRQWLRDEGRTDTQVWVTENQVNSDTPSLDGGSAHLRLSNDAPRFRADSRGTNAFFTAWRPYLFSQLGQAGNQALYQWQYTAGRCPGADAGCSVLETSDTDRQNAEVDYVSGQKYLSYWVDYWLARMFPPGADILKVDVATPGGSDLEVEVLAAKRSERDREVVVVMVVNWTVRGVDDRDGPGKPATAIVDLRAWLDDDAGFTGSWSATKLSIDDKTDLDGGPQPVSVSLQNQWVPIDFSGYGVSFLTLQRSTDGG